MTSKEAQQLIEAKKDIKYMQDDITELKESVNKLTHTTEDIKTTLDNLTGGKQALMWITGIFIALAGIVIAAINSLKK